MGYSRDKLWISTKLLLSILGECSPEDYEKVIEDNLKKSLIVLGLEYIDPYFCIVPICIQTRYLNALSNVQKKKLAVNVGGSVYDSEEARVELR